MKNYFLFFVLAISCLEVTAQSPQKATTKPIVAGNPGNAVAPAGNSFLKGVFSAPASSSVILQYNGISDLALTTAKENGMTVSSNAFQFPLAIADAKKYKVTLKKIPAAQTATIYAGAEGTAPQSSCIIKAGSDFTYDLLTRSSNDATFSTFYESQDADIGGSVGEEGRYTVFVSAAENFAGSTGKHRQVFRRDRNAGVTKLISISATGEEGNGDSFAPSISGDGKSVAFESSSTNIVEGDKNGVRDVFMWHEATNKSEIISIARGGKQADAESFEPSVSYDGNLVAFTSTASNISSTEKGISNNNVFIRDIKADNTFMISIDPVSKKGGGGSKSSISYDGKSMAFYSASGLLTGGDKNDFWDIFLWQKDSTSLKRISLTADHKEREQGSESANRVVAPSISGNGRFIAFATTAGNMVAGDNNNLQDVFVYDTVKDSTVIASIAADKKPGNADSPIGQGEKIAISFDGKWIAFSTNATNLGVPATNIVMRNMLTKENRPVSTVAGSSVGRAVISSSGSYVVFGIGAKLDSRFQSSGIFANYTGAGPCRSCPQ